MNKESLKKTFAQRLLQLRKMRGLSQSELASRTGGQVSSTAIEKYEHEEMYPQTSRILTNLAIALEVSIEELTRPMDLVIGEFSFRKKSKLGKKEEQRIKLTVQSKLEKFVEIEQIANDVLKYDLSVQEISVGNECDAIKVANRVRELLELGDGPISLPVQLLERHGVKIIELSEDPKLFDGTSNMVNGAPVLVINTNTEYKDRERFTLFHELGHQVLNFSEELQADTKEAEKKRENLCDVFANEMLITSDTFRKIFGEKRTLISSTELKSVQEEFGISVSALLYKAKQLHVITAGRYKWYVITINKNKEFKEKLERSGVAPMHSTRYKQLVLRSLDQDIITTNKAATLLETTVNEINNLNGFTNEFNF